ncbi:MAG: hypothetical protein MUC48_26025 [Leptolyngbya sp. Prado105]|nr:hypothetical protein [Leptolyngbya sp. Prado105]
MKILGCFSETRSSVLNFPTPHSIIALGTPACASETYAIAACAVPIPRWVFEVVAHSHLQVQPAPDSPCAEPLLEYCVSICRLNVCPAMGGFPKNLEPNFKTDF